MMVVGVLQGPAVELWDALEASRNAKPSPMAPRLNMIGWNCVAGTATSGPREAGESPLAPIQFQPHSVHETIVRIWCQSLP